MSTCVFKYTTLFTFGYNININGYPELGYLLVVRLRIVIKPKSVIRRAIIRGQDCNVLKISYLQSCFSNGGH